VLQNALERYNVVCRELGDLFHEKAKIDNAILMDWDEAYMGAVATGLSYNPAAAQAKSAVRRWTIELNKIQGKIDAALVELRYLDQYIKYAAPSNLIG
jgi:hypothetical protein